MIVTINEILNERGKTIYWLSKQLNCDYDSLKRLCNNNTTSISFDTIQKLCTALQCTPNQIFQIE